MEKKRIAIISFNPDEGHIHQRIHLPLKHLKDKYDFRSYTFKEFTNSEAYYTDAIIMSHAWNSSHMEIINNSLRWWGGLPVICDIDDLLSDVPSNHPGAYNFIENKLVPIITSSHHIVYSTDYLKKHYGYLNPRHTVIENSFSYKAYELTRPINKMPKTGFCVGWSGGQSHLPDQYYTFLEGLDKFMCEHEDVRAYFHVLCPERLISRHGAAVTFEPAVVHFLDYPAVSAAYPMDVCLVGLQDLPFNDAKSDLKLLEMAPNDILLIASPREDFLKHKDKDIMVYADDEDPNYMSWYEALNWVKDNPEKVAEMKARAKEYVLSHRRSDIAADKWDKVISTVLGVHEEAHPQMELLPDERKS